MSGILAIVSLTGAPVNQALLRKMTDFLAFRGPDSQEVWAEGPVGFGHAMFRTVRESEGERQPSTLDGRVWITADARVDDRDELVRKLTAQGRSGLASATDAELILHAYHVWGDDCVQHLLGDFAFAIWDGQRRRLFCARDHLGVKPFFYAHVGHSLILGSALDCVRLHPAISGEINELAIADFLLFRRNQNPATTVFTDVQRLPPAHCLVWAEGGLRVTPYWTFSLGREIRYERSRDYVEHFLELLRAAVADRLRGDRIGILMSGGLDSTTVAATARELLMGSGRGFDLRGYTVVYDSLIPDEERHYSSVAAAALGIPIHYVVADAYQPYERWERPESYRPEPIDEPKLAQTLDCFKLVAAQGRVALTGWNGDSFLNENPKPYMVTLLKNGRFGRWAAMAWQHLRTQRRPPPVGLRTTINRLTGRRPHWRCYPRWINQVFAMRLDLPTRWEQIIASEHGHPRRPRGVAAITALDGAARFEEWDAGASSVQLEIRHPLWDLRLVHYLLSLPPVPWCVDKHIVREGMRSVLPEAVRRRPKTFLAGDPEKEWLKRGGQWHDLLDPAELGKYVDTASFVRLSEEEIAGTRGVTTVPLSLNFWLKHPNRTSRREK